MDQNIISSIKNTSADYRRISARLTDLRDAFKTKEISVETAFDHEMNISLEIMESQIRELRDLAESLEDIAANYLRAGNPEGPEWLPETGYAPPEFGISEFANLEEHEKLMPIHKD